MIHVPIQRLVHLLTLGYANPSIATDLSFQGVTFSLVIMFDNGSALEVFEDPIVLTINTNVTANSSIYLFDTTTHKWYSAADTCNPPYEYLTKHQIV